jgi:hypothetical protein
VIEPRLRLFAVQCGPSEREASTFCVPASSDADAIIRAKAVAAECLEQGVPNPFEDASAKVRVGTFDPSREGKIKYGEWLSP